MAENSFLPIATDKMNEMVKAVNAMIQFVPEGANYLRSLYEYWKILEGNLNRLKNELLVEKKLARNRLSVLEQSIFYADKFRKLRPARKVDGSTFELVKGSAIDIRSLSDELEARLDFAKKSMFDPLEERIAEIRELIGETLRSSIAEAPPSLAIEMRRLMLDKDGGLCHILTVPSMPAPEYIRFCYCFVERIPLRYDFFADDVNSLESPDGMTWFYCDDEVITSDYSKSNEEHIKMCRGFHAITTPVKSHIPVIPPDNGPHYRIKYGAAFDCVEIFRDTSYDNKLKDDEFARFTGYLFSLKEDGIIDFSLNPID